MPTISTFFGIAIRMYYDDHAPPHFHVHYQSHSAIIRIDTLEIVSGTIPNRALAMVLEWAINHRQDLQDDWLLAEAHQPLTPIAPLE